MSGQTAPKTPQKTGRGYARNLHAGPFQPMIGSFELHLRAEKKSPKTIRTYLEAAQWMAAEYLIPASLTDWSEVTARHVQEWTVTLLGRYSDCYANNQFRALQQFFKWHATEDPDEPRPNPVAGLRPPKVGDKQLSLMEEADGWRYSLWVTNLPATTRGWRGQCAYVDAAHRAGGTVVLAGAGRCSPTCGRRGRDASAGWWLGRTGTSPTGRRATTGPRDGPGHAPDPAAKPCSQHETEFPSTTPASLTPERRTEPTAICRASAQVRRFSAPTAQASVSPQCTAEQN